MSLSSILLCIATIYFPISSKKRSSLRLLEASVSVDPLAKTRWFLSEKTPLAVRAWKRVSGSKMLLDCKGIGC